MEPKTIAYWQRLIHAINKNKGFHDRPLCNFKASAGAEPEDVNIDAVLAKLALIHSEVSEALEAAREGRFILYHDDNGKPEGMVTELADTVIRIMDTCEAMGLDLERAIAEKVDYNESRPAMHGGKLA